MSSFNSALTPILTPITPFDSPDAKRILFDKIDRIPDLVNSKISYFDGFVLTELRPYPPMCMGKYTSVIIRKVQDQKEIAKIQNPEASKKGEDNFYGELLSTGLSCSAAALSWVVVGGSAAVIPVSGGASTVITILSYSAATASSLQCMNSAYRLYNETNEDGSETNAWLDSQDWYTRTSTALDFVSVAGGVASVGATLKTVLNLRAAGTTMKEALKGLSRQSRKRLTEEIIRANNPNISNKILKSLVAAGKYPKRFSNVNITNSLRLQLKDAIGASLSFAGSATGGIMRDPQRIPNFIIGIIEEFDVY